VVRRLHVLQYSELHTEECLVEVDGLAPDSAHDDREDGHRHDHLGADTLHISR
jgi:hypothetical protein